MLQTRRDNFETWKNESKKKNKICFHVEPSSSCKNLSSVIRQFSTKHVQSPFSWRCRLKMKKFYSIFFIYFYLIKIFETRFSRRRGLFNEEISFLIFSRKIIYSRMYIVLTPCTHSWIERILQIWEVLRVFLSLETFVLIRHISNCENLWKLDLVLFTSFYF